MSLEDRLTIRIPASALMGCHNCKWTVEDKQNCHDGEGGVDCGWENDGTFEEW